MNGVPPKPAQRPGKNALPVLAAGCLLALVLLWGLGVFLVSGDPLEKADAVVLLAGGDDTRLEEAVRLYRDGFAHVFVLIETGERVGDTTGDFIELVHRKLIERSIPSDSILYTDPAPNSTAGEARAVRALMEQRGLHSAIVVTDPYHTRRAGLVYRDIFAGSDFRIIVHPSEGHWFQAATWWLRPEGWQTVFLEYGKLAGTVFSLVR